MNATTPPLFSEFIQMKKQNPSRYWTPATHAQMARSYQHHGPAFFDLHKDKGAMNVFRLLEFAADRLNNQ